MVERLPTEQPEVPEGDEDAGNEADLIPESSPGPDVEAPDEPDEGPKTAEPDEQGGGDSASADPTPEAEAEPEDELATALRERAEYLELAQRTQADLANFRKRAAKDAASAGERAKGNLIRELLPVVDNLERALASAGEAEEHLAGGVRLVHSELVGVLGRAGIDPYDPQGERFDPELHEALSVREQEGTEAGVVLDTVEKGYRLNGSVLRPARVVVSA